MKIKLTGVDPGMDQGYHSRCLAIQLWTKTYPCYAHDIVQELQRGGTPILVLHEPDPVFSRNQLHQVGFLYECVSDDAEAHEATIKD
jgi:hypothetical protein